MAMNQRRLKELLDYDPDTGEFRWKIHRGGCGGRVYPGALAGSIKTEGYRAIRLDGYGKFPAHRLAYLYMTGRWPPKGVDMDHINGDRADNRWSNLRLCSRAENCANLKKPLGVSGFKGVTPHKDRWKAQIRAHGKHYYLGLFDTPEEAHWAYCQASLKRLGEFARVPRPAARIPRPAPHVWRSNPIPGVMLGLSVTPPNLVIDGYAAGITSALC